MANRTGLGRPAGISGVEGVSWCELHSKWKVRIPRDGKYIQVGMVEDLDKARELREKALVTPTEALNALKASFGVQTKGFSKGRSVKAVEVTLGSSPTPEHVAAEAAKDGHKPEQGDGLQDLLDAALRADRDAHEAARVALGAESKAHAAYEIAKKAWNAYA